MANISDGVWQVSDIAIASVFAIVVVAVAAVIVGNLQTSFANTVPANSASANVLSSIANALNPFSSFLQVVILVALAAVLLFILIAAFGRKGLTEVGSRPTG
jgi:hypothetical protein